MLPRTPSLFFSLHSATLRSSSFPYTTLFRSAARSVFTCSWLSSWFCSTPPDRQIRRTLGGMFGGFAAEHPAQGAPDLRSEEHTSELQSHSELVCRLLLEKKKKKQIRSH